MKNIAAIALVIVATFIAAGPAPAQDRVVKATVPFNFTVGEQTLPSGTYIIGPTSTAPNLITMRNWDKHVAVMSLGQSGQSYRGTDNTLVFYQYGGQYFLRDIHSEGASMHVHFTPSKAEKRAKSQVEEAGRFVNDPVLIALK